MKMTQRKAICMAFGWDYADLTEYQPSWKRGPVKVYCGEHPAAEYLIAQPAGKAIPAALVEEFGEWVPLDTFGGWTVYGAAMQEAERNSQLPPFMREWSREQIETFMRNPNK